MVKKIKPLIFTLGVMAILLFFWWFSGGSIIYGLKKEPPPSVKATAFIFRNFQAGTAFILNSLADFLCR